MDNDEDIIIYSVSTCEETDTKWLHKKNEKYKVWKILFLFYLATFFLHLGVNSAYSTQFYFYPGSYTQLFGWSNVIAAAVRVFVTLGTETLVQKIGIKNTMFYGVVLQMTYVIALYYPCWPTMVISAVFSGCGSAMMDLASMVFLSKLAIYYARNSKRDVYNQLLRYMTLYSVIVCFTQLLSQLVTLEALGSKHSTLYQPQNSTSLCDVNYCPSTSLVKDTTVVYSEVFWIFGFSFINLAVSVSFIWNLEALNVFHISETEDSGIVVKFGVKTPGLMQKVRRTLSYLIIPVNIISASGTSVFLLDFLQDYVICPFGVNQTTSVISTYTLTFTLSAFVLGWLTIKKYRFQLLLGLTVKLGIAIMLITCPYNVFSSMNMALVLSSIWALADGTLAPGITAMYAETFADRLLTSMIARQFWNSSAILLIHIFSLLLCMDTKLFIQLGLAIIAFVHYPIIELIVRHQNLEKLFKYNSYNSYKFI